MTIRSKMTLGPFVHEVEFAPAETIVPIVETLLSYTPPVLAWRLISGALTRLGAADRIDQEEGTQQPFGGWGMPSKRGR